MPLLLLAAWAGSLSAAEHPFAVHTVKAGDTVQGVAARYRIDPMNLTAANGLSAADALPPAGTVLLIPKSPKDVLATLYEAKRRGLGAWPKPRFADEFLAPLVPQEDVPESRDYRAKVPDRVSVATPKGGHEQLRPDEAAATAPTPAPKGEEPAAPPAPEAASGRKPDATEHLVREGDTLYRIARSYGVSFSELLRVNSFTESTVIRIGQKIRLPGAADTPTQEKAPPKSAKPRAREAKPTQPPQPAKQSGLELQWPLRSGSAPKQVGTNFGSGLSASAKPGETVYAAADATVLHGGWMKDFGNAVYLNHGNGIATFYGGLGTLYVTSGQTVKRGTKIATIGDGPAPKLVFHLLRDGKSVDPRPYLAKQ